MDFEILNKTILVVAKRNSGKSQLIRYLVLVNKHLFDKMFLICPTENVNSFYSDIIEKKHILTNYNEDFIKNLIDTMTRANSNQPKDKRQQVLLILDDCISDTTIKNSKPFELLFTRGRHINISIIFVSQYLKAAISPVIRNNIDFCLFSQVNAHGLRLIFEEYNYNLSKPEFNKLFKNATKDYGFLVINNNSVKNGDIDEIYGVIKTPKEYLKLQK